MAEISFRELSPEVLAAAPGVPQPTVIRAIRNACRDFCERSAAYRYDIESEPVVHTEVEFVTPENTQVVRPISLTLDGEPLLPSSTVLLNEANPNWRNEFGTPTHYYRAVEYQNSIMVAPAPDRNYVDPGIQGQLALKPTRDATGVEEIILDRYQTALVSGALKTLLMISNKPWYNPQQASYHGQVFEEEIANAKIYAEGGDLPKKTIVKYGGI